MGVRRMQRCDSPLLAARLVTCHISPACKRSDEQPPGVGDQVSLSLRAAVRE